MKPVCHFWFRHTRAHACTPGGRGGVTCPEPQCIGRATSNLRFLNSSTSAFPIICTNTLSKGIRVNLVLRNCERVLTPPFPVIIRSPWGCHQSRAGWPASLSDPRVIRFQREDVVAGPLGWVVLPACSLVLYIWRGWQGVGRARPGIPTWAPGFAVYTPAIPGNLNFCIWDLRWTQSFTGMMWGSIFENVF